MQLVSLIGLSVWLLGCDRVAEQRASFASPVGDVTFHSFSTIQWVTSPTQRVNIRVKETKNVEKLVDFRLFGDFQPELTDDQVTAQFGAPTQKHTDDFGGMWWRYSTPLGYLEIGTDLRTSTSDDDKSPVLGRRSLRAYTDEPADAVLLSPLRDVVREAKKITPRADHREINMFDAENRLLVQIILKGSRLTSAELFVHINR